MDKCTISSFTVALRNRIPDINKKLVDLDIDAKDIITIRESSLLEETIEGDVHSVPALEVLYRKRASHN